MRDVRRTFTAVLIVIFCATVGGTLPFDICYHTDGGSCVESRPGDCCEGDASPSSDADQACPDCTDILARSALPGTRASQSATSPDSQARVVWRLSSAHGPVPEAPLTSVLASIDPDVGDAALLSLPLRC